MKTETIRAITIILAMYVLFSAISNVRLSVKIAKLQQAVLEIQEEQGNE